MPLAVLCVAVIISGLVIVALVRRREWKTEVDEVIGRLRSAGPERSDEEVDAAIAARRAARKVD
jgi:hypothetical protein